MVCMEDYALTVCPATYKGAGITTRFVADVGGKHCVFRTGTVIVGVLMRIHRITINSEVPPPPFAYELSLKT